MLLDITVLKHKGTYSLQLTLTKKGVWITVGSRTLKIINKSSPRLKRREIFVEFSVGFGVAFKNMLFMELGRTSFDVKNGIIVMEQMY